MPINEGRKAHQHATKALEMLAYHWWTFEYMANIRDELYQAAEMMYKHISTSKCPCCDTITDADFYMDLAIAFDLVVDHQDLSLVPVLHEDLTKYLQQKMSSHSCIPSIIKAGLS